MRFRVDPDANGGSRKAVYSSLNLAMRSLSYSWAQLMKGDRHSLTDDFSDTLRTANRKNFRTTHITSHGIDYATATRYSTTDFFALVSEVSKAEWRLWRLRRFTKIN